MVEPVQGFLADDGRFFPTAEECEAYESQEVLKTELAALGIKDPAQAFGLINKCRISIMRYLNAVASMPEDMEIDNDEGELGGIKISAGDGESEDDDYLGEGDIGDAEEDAETIQLLPPGVHKPMPDLGRHIQPTKIRHERKINGPRGGQPDARDIRDSKGVATPPRRPAPKARRGDR